MLTVLEIEKSIQTLSIKEMQEFRNWFYEYENKNWDLKIENDIKNNKLSNLSDQAIKQFHKGEFKAL